MPKVMLAIFAWPYIEADVHWNNEISSAIWDPGEFIKLDDTILKRIEWSKEPQMDKARDIVSRIRRRELYRYVNEYAVPQVGTGSNRPRTVCPYAARCLLTVSERFGTVRERFGAELERFGAGSERFGTAWARLALAHRVIVNM